MSNKTDNIKSAYILNDEDRIIINDAIGKASTRTDIKNKIAGGIVPHHLLAAQMTADFFQSAKPSDPSVILIIGPDHLEEGNYSALTSNSDWITFFGDIESFNQCINNLTEKNIAKIDEKTIFSDQSIGNLVPFVKYYFPKAKIIPLLLSRSISIKEIDLIANEFKNFRHLNIMPVASVDFSHYEKSNIANENDGKTLEYLQNGDYEKLMSLNSAFSDCPQCLVLFDKIMKSNGIKKTEILGHGNSGDILKDSTIATTGYYSIAYFGE